MVLPVSVPYTGLCGFVKVKVLKDLQRDRNWDGDSNFTSRASFSFPSLHATRECSVVNALWRHVGNHCWREVVQLHRSGRVCPKWMGLLAQ